MTYNLSVTWSLVLAVCCVLSFIAPAEHAAIFVLFAFLSFICGLLDDIATSLKKR